MTQSSKIAQPPSLRKAAILVAALDRQYADNLLDELGPAGAARVRAAVMDLDDVSEQEQRQVIAEFMRYGPSSSSVVSAGIELDDSLAEKLGEERIGPAALSEVPENLEPPPFRFLHEANTDGLAKHLEREHAQIIAVVVAHLQPKQGADLIKRFPEALQVDVLRRVAELDATSPEVLRDLESQLEVILSDEIRAERNRSLGVGAVASILEAAGTARSDLLHAVARGDKQLMSLIAQNHGEQHSPPVRQDALAARRQVGSSRKPSPGPEASRRAPQAPTSNSRHKPRQKRTVPAKRSISTGVKTPRQSADTPGEKHGIDFDDLGQLDDRALGTLFQSADACIVVLALTGADEGLIRRILRQFPAGESKKLQRRMKNLGPIQISDVERAQRRIAELATRLASRDVIPTPKARRFAVAA